MAEFYGTVDGYREYCFDRNSLHKNEPDDKIQAALLVASEWLDSEYRSSFPGLKVGLREQVREWPRTGSQDIYGYAISEKSVPVEVINATYEAAHRELDNTGSLSVDYTPSRYKRASVDGAVDVEFRHFDSASEAQIKIMIVDQILRPVLTGPQGMLSNTVGQAVRA